MSLTSRIGGKSAFFQLTRNATNIERVSSSMFTHLIPLIEQLTQDEIAAIETALHRVLAKEETAEDER